MNTKTIQLAHGFVDAKGDTHKDVTLRVPKMRDEATAELAATKAGFGSQSSYFACAMIAQCVTQWIGIASVTVDHVLDLYRSDVLLLQNALAELEAQDTVVQPSKNSPSGER